MSDLIERQDVLDVIRNLAFNHIFQCGEYYGEDERQLTIINAGKALDVIESLPSAEPERKKGEWKNIALFTRECSECGAQFHELEYDNFCPNCGAEMEREDIPMEYFENGGI